GVKKEAMEELANLYGKEKPLAAWLGFGLQRNKYGEFNIEAIISLSALTGNLNEQFGGIYYAHDNINRFPLNLLNFPEKKHPSIPRSRTIHNKNFAIKANELTDPPLKFLWIAARNPLSQDQHLQEWKKL